MTRSLQSEADKIIVGRLGAPRGLNGELKLIPLTDFDGRFDDLSEVFIDNKVRRVDYVREIGKGLVIRFEGVDTRDAAQPLTNKLLKVDRSNAAPLDDGEYYTFDIIGLDVFNLDGRQLGTVTNVLKTGSNDVFVAGTPDGRELLIPALKRVVKSIELDKKSMVIDEATLEEI